VENESFRPSEESIPFKYDGSLMNTFGGASKQTKHNLFDDPFLFSKVPCFQLTLFGNPHAGTVVGVFML